MRTATIGIVINPLRNVLTISKNVIVVLPFWMLNGGSVGGGIPAVTFAAMSISITSPLFERTKIEVRRDSHPLVETEQTNTIYQ